MCVVYYYALMLANFYETNRKSRDLYSSSNVQLTALLTFRSLFLRSQFGSVGVLSAQHLGQRLAGTLPSGLARDVEPRAPLPGPVRLRSGLAPLRVMVLRL